TSTSTLSLHDALPISLTQEFGTCYGDRRHPRADPRLRPCQGAPSEAGQGARKRIAQRLQDRQGKDAGGDCGGVISILDAGFCNRSEEHTSELQSRRDL